MRRRPRWDRLIDQWDADLVAELDPEDYYDFQMTRPAHQLQRPGAAHHHLADVANLRRSARRRRP
jgi:hypothetical protein